MQFLIDIFLFQAFSRSVKYDNVEYNLQIIDTAGQVSLGLQNLWQPNHNDHDFWDFLIFQDEYSLLPEAYAMDMNGYILVYSVNSSKRWSAFFLQVYYHGGLTLSPK